MRYLHLWKPPNGGEINPMGISTNIAMIAMDHLFGDLPTKNSDFPVRYLAMLVYQRVNHTVDGCEILHHLDWMVEIGRAHV